jgi:predicted aldo/keto reductase-like oxidoreductase
VAIAAAKSGDYETIQFPLNYLATKKDLELIAICKQNDVGLIAMKGMSGGLISDSAAASAFLRQYDNVLPIWGVQHKWELEEFLAYEDEFLKLSEEHQKHIDEDRIVLSGDFCRGCGYCLPCPANIEIPTAARMSLLLRRAVAENFTTEEFQKKMARIDDCIDCGHCREHCPYELDTPNLLKREYAFYKEFIKNNGPK